MLRTLFVALSFTLAVVGCLSREPLLPIVKIETNQGVIEACLFVNKAPKTAGQYLSYVEAGAFDNTAFYRVVRDDNQPNNKIKIDVIQGGRSRWDGTQLVDLPSTLPDLMHETTQQSGLKHTAGALSMARMAPGSANDHIFITVENEPELDFGGMRNPDGQGAGPRRHGHDEHGP